MLAVSIIIPRLLLPAALRRARFCRLFLHFVCWPRLRTEARWPWNPPRKRKARRWRDELTREGGSRGLTRFYRLVEGGGFRVPGTNIVRNVQGRLVALCTSIRYVCSLDVWILFSKRWSTLIEKSREDRTWNLNNFIQLRNQWWVLQYIVTQ